MCLPLFYYCILPEAMTFTFFCICNKFLLHNTITKNAKEFFDVHVVTFVYGKRSILNYLNKAASEGRLIDIKKEASPQVMSQVQYEGDVNGKASFNDSISENGKKCQW